MSPPGTQYYPLKIVGVFFRQGSSIAVGAPLYEVELATGETTRIRATVEGKAISPPHEVGYLLNSSSPIIEVEEVLGTVESVASTTRATPPPVPSQPEDDPDRRTEGRTASSPKEFRKSRPGTVEDRPPSSVPPTREPSRSGKRWIVAVLTMTCVIAILMVGFVLGSQHFPLLQRLTKGSDPEPISEQIPPHADRPPPDATPEPKELFPTATLEVPDERFRLVGFAEGRSGRLFLHGRSTSGNLMIVQKSGEGQLNYEIVPGAHSDRGSTDKASISGDEGDGILSISYPIESVFAWAQIRSLQGTPRGTVRPPESGMISMGGDWDGIQPVILWGHPSDLTSSERTSKALTLTIGETDPTILPLVRFLAIELQSGEQPTQMIVKGLKVLSRTGEGRRLAIYGGLEFESLKGGRGFVSILQESKEGKWKQSLKLLPENAILGAMRPRLPEDSESHYTTVTDLTMMGKRMLLLTDAGADSKPFGRGAATVLLSSPDDDPEAGLNVIQTWLSLPVGGEIVKGRVSGPIGFEPLIGDRVAVAVVHSPVRWGDHQVESSTVELIIANAFTGKVEARTERLLPFNANEVRLASISTREPVLIMRTGGETRIEVFEP